MYSVSDAYKTAIQDNTRSFSWSGTITTTSGKVYPFENKDIVKGSGYVSRQCSGSSEIELGSVYAAELGMSLFSDIDRYSLENAEVELIPDRSKPMEEVIADRMLLEQLFARLRELDPEADTIIRLWKDHPEGISDRAIARELVRPQKTFADQMKKYRTDLRRITGDK